jgi:hypothetical protein
MTAFRDALQPVLPNDAAQAALAGHLWRPDAAGPSVVAVRDGALFDVTCARPRIQPPRCAAPLASGSAASMPCWATRRSSSATADSPGCWHRSTSRRSRPPA